MHRFDEDDTLSGLLGKLDELYEKMDKAIDKLTDEEGKVYDEISETIDGDKKVDYEEGFFEQSASALSKHFGKKITEPVRKALLATWMWEAAEDDCDEMVDAMSEEEEE